MITIVPGPEEGRVPIIWHWETSHRGQFCDGYSGPMNLMLIETHQQHNSSSVIHACCYCKESQSQTPGSGFAEYILQHSS